MHTRRHTREDARTCTPHTPHRLSAARQFHISQHSSPWRGPQRQAAWGGPGRRGPGPACPREVAGDSQRTSRALVGSSASSLCSHPGTRQGRGPSQVCWPGLPGGRAIPQRGPRDSLWVRKRQQQPPKRRWVIPEVNHADAEGATTRPAPRSACRPLALVPTHAHLLEELAKGPPQVQPSGSGRMTHSRGSCCHLPPLPVAPSVNGAVEAHLGCSSEPSHPRSPFRAKTLPAWAPPPSRTSETPQPRPP